MGDVAKKGAETMIITIEAYWLSLSPEQVSAIESAHDRADEQGLELHIEDALDLWYLLPKHLRGAKPAVNRCSDCGEIGENKGHMGCQYPQD